MCHLHCVQLYIHAITVSPEHLSAQTHTSTCAEEPHTDPKTRVRLDALRNVWRTKRGLQHTTPRADHTMA